MNVIVSNLNKDLLSGLDIDVIKSLDGEFMADEIVQSFSNFFYNKMIIDVTAIKNYDNIDSFKKISIGLDSSKIILLLNDDSKVNSEFFISKLISLGFYNFSDDINQIKYLYNNPNSYKDVAYMQKVNEYEVEHLVVQEQLVDSDVRVIGFKNFTNHSGATSLIYMLKKQLSKNYSVVCLEINKKDFFFFRDKDMISISSNNFEDYLLKYKHYNIILVDLNDFNDVIASSLCHDVIYLVEPSILKINKISMLNSKSFNKLRDYKVVLNKCLFNDKDSKIFGREGGFDIFYKIPPLNDRENNSSILLPFLEKLGLYSKKKI